MHYIKLLYPADLTSYSLGKGETQEYQEVFIDWSLPFLPRVGENFDLESFLDIVEDKGNSKLSPLWRVGAILWVKGEDGSIQLNVWIDGYT